MAVSLQVADQGGVCLEWRGRACGRMCASRDWAVDGVRVHHRSRWCARDWIR